MKSKVSPYNQREFDGIMFSAMWYASWYKKDVSSNLNFEQKKNVAKRISDLSLRQPLFAMGDIPLDDFPELKPFAHTKNFTGTQLYAVLSEIIIEISKTKIPTPYPHLPEFKKGMKHEKKCNKR